MSNMLTIEEVLVYVPNVIIIKLVDFNFIVILIYRPPSNSEQENDRLCYKPTGA